MAAALYGPHKTPVCTCLPHLGPRRYDGHKEAILRSGERHQAGGTGGFTGGQRPDDEVDLYAYFTSACFSGFGDGPRVRECLLLLSLFLFKLHGWAAAR